jgi:hypothetical protein
MMSMAPAITGAISGRSERIFSRENASSQKHTPITKIFDPKLRVAIQIFSDALDEPMNTMRNLFDTYLANSSLGLRRNVVIGVESHDPKVTSFIGGPLQVQLSTWIKDDWLIPSDLPRSELQRAPHPVTDGADNAVTAVLSISNRVGLPIRDVVEAAGISRSSFYSWRTPQAPEPRVSSQGRLWELAQLVEDLEELVGSSVDRWLMAEPQRRVDFTRGDFQKLLDSAVPSNRKVQFAAPYSALYAVGGDEQENDNDVPHRKSSGRVKLASTVRANKRLDG